MVWLPLMECVLSCSAANTFGPMYGQFAPVALRLIVCPSSYKSTVEPPRARKFRVKGFNKQHTRRGHTGFIHFWGPSIYPTWQARRSKDLASLLRALHNAQMHTSHGLWFAANMFGPLHNRFAPLYLKSSVCPSSYKSVLSRHA